MARIPDDQIDRLKQDVSVQRLAEGMGITLRRHGADLIGHSPGGRTKLVFSVGRLVSSPTARHWCGAPFGPRKITSTQPSSRT